MKFFIIKVLTVTICIYFLLNNFLPKYVFIDENHRCNRVTGKVEYRSSFTGTWNHY